MWKKIALISMCLGSDAVIAAADADEIIRQARDRDDGKSFVSNVVLTLQDKNGGKRTREFVYLQKDYEQDDKFTIFFTSPSDVRGVAFHIINPHELIAEEDRQWMYLPVSRQTRRISTTDKRGSFMGSNYAYTDLDKLRVEDFHQEITGSELINGRECNLLTRTPVSRDVINKTGYHKVHIWIDKENHLVMRQDFFDIKGVMFKQMKTLEVGTIDGVDSILLSTTDHLINGTKSEMRFNDLRYNIPLDDKLFTQGVIRSGIKATDIPSKNLISQKTSL